LYGVARALFEATDYRPRPIDQAEFDRQFQAARHALSQERFDAMAAEGRAMTMEQAIRYALGSFAVP
jgi:hypothetical protein